MPPKTPPPKKIPLFEQKVFLWTVMGSSFFIVFSVIGFMGYQHYREIRAHEEKLEAKKMAERAYIDQFRSTLTRVYQNLQLDHFLAAHKNLEALKRPDLSGVPVDSLMIQEYIDALYRVGRGLLQTGFLKEAETIFFVIKEMEDESARAGDSINEIISKRRHVSALSRLQIADELLGQKRFRDALGEYQKAETELNSVDAFGFEETKKERDRLARGMADSKFEVLISEAERIIREAESALKSIRYSDTQKRMSIAAKKVGMAAFLKPNEERVGKLRKRLVDMEAELSFALPNLIPILNIYKESDHSGSSDFFFMRSYVFEHAKENSNVFKLSMTYMRRHDERRFVVRYRLFFNDGSDFFNSHFLNPIEGEHQSDEVHTVDYLQELPEKHQGKKVLRVDFRVFDETETMYSRVIRALRESGS